MTHAVLEQMPGLVILQPNYAVSVIPGSIVHIPVTKLPKPAVCGDRILLLCDDKLQLNHAPAAKIK